jgi:hypothetical protein
MPLVCCTVQILTKITVANASGPEFCESLHGRLLIWSETRTNEAAEVIEVSKYEPDPMKREVHGWPWTVRILLSARKTSRGGTLVGKEEGWETTDIRNCRFLNITSSGKKRKRTGPTSRYRKKHAGRTTQAG